MPEWLLPALLSVVIALLAYFLKKDRQSIEDRLKEANELRDRVRSVEQELYGAKGDNGHRERIRELDLEQRYQGAVVHWIGNVVMATADKAGVVIRSDRPKRTDFR